MKPVLIALGVSVVFVAVLLFVFIEITAKKGAELGLQSTVVEESK